MAAVNGGAAKTRFLAMFPNVRDELVQHMREHKMPEDACSRFSRNLDYNVPTGKLNRGVTVVESAEILLGRPLLEDESSRAVILGWCVELLQATFLVTDDMMDSCELRRGQPSWYKLSGIGTDAINDSFLLEASIYYLLKKYFRHEPYYVDLLELFQETTLRTGLGQLIDLLTAPQHAVDLSRFSLDRHQLIVVWKTAYYSFFLPVALAMHFTRITDTAAFTHAARILIPLGEYFQVQDDFLDCYGAPEVIGKVGTDIADNKCSWLVNVALSLASDRERKVLQENYGRRDDQAVQRVKAVFERLGVRGRYEEYEERCYGELCALIDQIPETGTGQAPSLRREVFHSLLRKIYHRTK
ncbi:geranyltranstransferase [Auricularia subglabra TFB-10046 SS5]|nr:geranyltranstransferase [Auricularia subglabra TFB-10046 SS5]